MKLFKSLQGENFRKIFLSFFAISSILPFLIMFYVMETDGKALFSTALTYSLLLILLLRRSGCFLMSQCIASLENRSRQAPIQSGSLASGHKDFCTPTIAAAEM